MKRSFLQSTVSKSVNSVLKSNSNSNKKIKKESDKSSEDNNVLFQQRILTQLRTRKNMKLYAEVINDAAKHKNYPFAKQVFEDLQKQNLRPDIFTYTCIINAAVRGYELEDAERYITEMKSKKVNPNEVTYTTLIRGATQLFDMKRASEYFNSMVVNGVAPNCRTFNTLLRGCFRTGDADYSKSVVSSMNHHHVKPDAVSLELLTMIDSQNMDLISAANRLDSFQQFLSSGKAPAVSIKPTLYLLMASVSVLCGHPLKKAKKLLEKFKTSLAQGSQSDRSDSKTLPDEIWREFTILNTFIEKDSGIPKEITQFSKLGPKHSPFVLSYPSNPNYTHFFESITSKYAQKSTTFKLEVCSGSGDWLLDRATKDQQNAHWFGLEIRYDRVHEMWRKSVLSNQTSNLSVIHSDAKLALKIFPKNSVSEVFINFPDPPLLKDSPQRLINSQFLTDISKAVVKGGKVIILTDDIEYSRWIEEDAQALAEYDFTKTLINDDLPDYGTSFFDELWEHRGRKQRRWITLFTKASNSL